MGEWERRVLCTHWGSVRAFPSPRSPELNACLPLPTAHTRSKSHLHHLKKSRKLEAASRAAGGDAEGTETSGEERSVPVPRAWSRDSEEAPGPGWAQPKRAETPRGDEAGV